MKGTQNAEVGMRNEREMKKDELRERTKAFALRAIRLTDALPENAFRVREERRRG